MKQDPALAIEGTWEPFQLIIWSVENSSGSTSSSKGSEPLWERIGTGCISQRLISTVCRPLMCIQVCLVKTAHLLSNAHTHTQKERRGLVTLLLGDLLLPRGAEGTDLLPTLLNETGRDERREWVRWINERRASGGTGLMGFCSAWHWAWLTGRLHPLVLPAHWSTSKGTRLGQGSRFTLPL